MQLLKQKKNSFNGADYRFIFLKSIIIQTPRHCVNGCDSPRKL